VATLERTAHSHKNIRQMLFILILFFVLSGFVSAGALPPLPASIRDNGLGPNVSRWVLSSVSGVESQMDTEFEYNEAHTQYRFRVSIPQDKKAVLDSCLSGVDRQKCIDSSVVLSVPVVRVDASVQLGASSKSGGIKPVVDDYSEVDLKAVPVSGAVSKSLDLNSPFWSEWLPMPGVGASFKVGWNSQEWIIISSAVVPAVLFDWDGVLLAGCGEGCEGVRFWNTSSEHWEKFGVLNSDVYSLVVKDGVLYAGGDFTGRVSLWNESESAWQVVGGGLDSGVYSLVVKDGVLYAGGYFTGRVSLWNPYTHEWQVLGGISESVNRTCHTYYVTSCIGIPLAAWCELAYGNDGLDYNCHWDGSCQDDYEDTCNADTTVWRGGVGAFINAFVVQGDFLYAGGMGVYYFNISDMITTTTTSTTSSTTTTTTLISVCGSFTNNTCDYYDLDESGCNSHYVVYGEVDENCLYNGSSMLCSVSGVQCVASTTTTTTTSVSTSSGSTTSTTLAAFLSNVSISPVVHLNDVVSASVYLTNSNGPLEGQDCSVVSYFNGTILHDYHTLCQYAPQIICGLLSESGGCNYAATTNCSFTDSAGGYYFTGRTDESLGYSWNKTYELRFICNAKNSSAYFTLELEKQPDTSKLEAFLNQYGGMIVLGFLGTGALLVFAVILVSFLSWAWHRGRKKR
jgi:hypothetical protein